MLRRPLKIEGNDMQAVIFTSSLISNWRRTGWPVRRSDGIVDEWWHWSLL